MHSIISPANQRLSAFYPHGYGVGFQGAVAMEGEAGYHRFFCLGDFLVEDKVTNAVIDWHLTYGVYWLEDVGMMPDDGRYSCLGKSVGKSALTDAWIGLKLHTPMQDH